ncbi:hypothetical protein ASD37_00820 [Mycobacterium sp. Root135]|uniref:hypothetical protein n=1 Tax=Mycobacterium sp. Root135 TaxID=1736457 RepID=UPI0006FA6221|nr:hypothetical protein [Mycobacterium sp. Root135]KQY09064.1 hypothetical protein ASD37_00820 [Mycobacterium sp. Root135]
MSVAPDELTGTEQAVLLVLMAEARPVRNPELRDLGPELKKGGRDRLLEKKLIEVTTESRAMALELTDSGWATCAAIIGAAVPERPSGQGRALYTVLRALRRHLDREGLAPADLFFAQDDSVDVESQVRAAYVKLAARAGGWVDLVRLRAELPDVTKSELDDALTQMQRQPGVSLIPEENQKTLTDEDHAAAVDIGNRARHLIAIES